MLNSRFLILALVLSAAIPVQAEWKATDAALRFTYHLSDSPTHDSAGYFVAIPDGGVLPKP